MTHKAAVTEQIKAIPRRRLAAKISKSVFGLLFIAGAAYGAATLGWAWYVVLPVAMFGAHIFSEELTRTAVQFVVATVKDLLATIRGKNGSPPAA